MFGTQADGATRWQRQAAGLQQFSRVGCGNDVHLRGTDELGNKLVGRPVVQVQRRAHLLNAAITQHHHAVGQRHGFDLVVGDVNRGGTQITMQLGDLYAGLSAQGSIQIGQRLIKQKHLGRAHNGTPDRHPLALSAREFFGRALQVFGEIEDVRGAGHLVLDLGLRHIGQLEGKTHVLEHTHVRIQRVALEHHGQIALAGRGFGDVAPIERHTAGVGLLQPGNQAQQRGFAAARRADENHKFAALDFQVDALDDAQRAKLFLNAAQLEVRHGRASIER